MDMFVAAGPDCEIQPGAQVGLQYGNDCKPVRLGAHARIRSGTIIYCDVTAGNHFQTGHHALIRAETTLGDHVTIGTNVVIEGQVTIGSFVKIEAGSFIPTHSRIGSRVFFGPNVTVTNDRFPLRRRDEYVPQGCTIEDNVTIGAGVVLCPGVKIGAGSFLAAGAVVTKDVPPDSLAIGVPARIEPLPEKLREPNMALSWRKYLGPDNGR